MKPLDFIQIVAEELSISEEESQKLLAEFTAHLNNELNNTNAVQLPGLGILKKDISAFSLELDPSFAIEINFKYAGMQPIVVSDDINVGIEEAEEPEVEDVGNEGTEEKLEINEASEVDQEPGVEQKPEINEEPEAESESTADIQPGEEPEVEEERGVDQEPEVESESTADIQPDEEPEVEEERGVDEEPEAESESTADVQPDEEPEVEEKNEIDEGSEADEEPGVEQKPEIDEEPEADEEPNLEPELDEEAKARIARRTASLRNPKKTKRRNLTPLYVGIGIVFIAAMIAGWQFYLKPILEEPTMLVGNSGNEPSNIATSKSLSSSQEEQQRSMAVDDIKNDSAVEDSTSMAINREIITDQENNSLSTNLDSVVSAPIMAKGATEIPAGQPLYGLLGEVDRRANDGYTLVLFSLSNRQSAMEKYEQYRIAGYRSLLSPVNSNRYGLMWRVSIGQFATVEQALEVAKELPKELIEDYFITKI